MDGGGEDSVAGVDEVDEVEDYEGEDCELDAGADDAAGHHSGGYGAKVGGFAE